MAGKRGLTTGWSKTATRNNIKFLRSVDERSLTGDGYAVTLTIKDCPASSEEWSKVRANLVKRLQRMGMIRLHWVTEWQRRGVPHLHLVVYMPPVEYWAPWRIITNKFGQSTLEKSAAYEIIEAWLQCTHHWGSSKPAQDVKPIADAVGWFQYVAKHASRGEQHYQRSDKAIPAGWKKTGRVWGKSGDWKTQEPMHLNIEDSAFYRYRRIIRKLRCARKSVNGDWRQLKLARGMLKCSDLALSRVRGTSEWTNLETNLLIADYLRMSGFKIDQSA